MKQLYGKLWVKCTAIALLVVFAILFAASALGTAYLFTYGAYADGGEQVRQIAENEILQQTNGDGWTALHAWVDDDKITRDLLRERYDPLTSNIYFKLTDKDTGKILFSTGALNKDDYTGKASAYYQQDMTTSLDDGSEVTAVYQAYLKSPLAPRDSALYIMTWVERLISARYLLIVLAVLLLAVCLFLFIFLLCAMGHKEGVDGIYQCWLNKIPLDLFALLLIFLFYAWATFVSEIWYINGWYYILLIFGTAALALTLILSVAGRAKAPGFFKNTIVYMVFAWIFRGLGRIPMVWRTMLIWAGFCFIDLLLMFDGSSAAALWWLFSRGVLTVGILYLASSLKLLQKEGQAIADGQTDYKGKPIPPLAARAQKARGKSAEHPVRHPEGRRRADTRRAHEDRAHHQRLPRHQDAADLHRQLRRSSGKGGHPAGEGEGIRGRAAPAVRAAQEADGGSGRGVEGLVRLPAGTSGADGRERAAEPAGGRLSRKARGRAA